MMFKVTWEKTNNIHQLPANLLGKMVQLAYPNQKLISHQLIAGGCANLNFRIQLENEMKPLILRVYLRKPSAAYQEQALAALIKATIPAPLTYYLGEVATYHFAITEFIPGIPLRTLLLSNERYDLSNIMDAVGELLTKIITYKFSTAGFFDQQLNIIPIEVPDFEKLIQVYLAHQTVLAVLSTEIISQINKLIVQYAALLPTSSETYLVHGDFDPANILVDKIKGHWVITGILDWEFAFSGSYLWDIANMLRYAHKMPAGFQDSFIQSLTKYGIQLPENWNSRIQLLNLLSLLECLTRSDPRLQPNRCTDICDLVTHLLIYLNRKYKI